MSEERRGYVYGLVAYAIWGFFPIYFKLLQPAGALEILAHRVIWSVVFVAVVLIATRKRRIPRNPGIVLAALLIAVNWGTYIYGVNSDRVVETALGYFITPLVVVLLGVTVQREHLRVGQWIAIGVGAVAVVVLTVDYGRLPWIALILAGSFGSYSLVKKRLALPPAEGLFVESSVIAIPALAYLVVINVHHTAKFGHVSAGHTALMVFSGVATAIPLLLFAGAANRVPMVGIGILQYVAPIIQLACGVFLYHEPMPPARLAGFGLVWIALIIFTADALRTARKHSAGKHGAGKHGAGKHGAGKHGAGKHGAGKHGAGKQKVADPTAATVEPATAAP